MREMPSGIESYERMILDSSSLAILQIQKGNIAYANARARTLLAGDEAAALEGQPIDHSLLGNGVDLRAVLEDSLNNNVASEQKGCTVVDAEGHHKPAHLFIMPLQHQKQRLLQIIVEPLTDETFAAEEVMDAESIVASGTPKGETKTLCPPIVRKALANVAKGKQVTLLSIRLENIARLVQILGEKNIDQVAVEVRNKLESVLGKEVLIENPSVSIFHILVGTRNQALLEQVAGKLAYAMDELVIDVAAQILQVATAISILPVAKDADANILLSRINTTLAKAAEKGLNHWYFFDAAEELVEQACQGDPSSLVQYAIDQGRFRLLFQPVINLTGEKKEHYAVLLRILDPNNKEVMASQFAGEVDRLPQAVRMDRWVILHSIKQLFAHRKKTSTKAYLFIHLSSASLQDKALLPWILSVLQKIPIGADSLVLQFTESNAMRYREDTLRFLQGAKKIGFKTSMSDFGLSLKPMKCAEEFITDYVRLDVSLTNNMEDNKAQENKVAELIQLLSNMKRKTMAVLVESPNALSAYWRTRVDFVQGFFVQQPKPDMDYDFSMDE